MRIAAAALLTVLSVPASVQPAAAATDIHLSTGTGANYRLQVTSWWEIPFRSIIRQQYDFSCGSAAVATLLTFHYGHNVSERESFAAMWESGNQASIREVGFSMLEMKTFLEELGYNVEGYRLSGDQLASFDRPSIVLLDQNGYKHFVVVKGVRGEHVIVGDPMLGLRQYSVADFSKAWNGVALAITDAPEPVTPIYNAPRDWDPWSRAPTTTAATPGAVSELTDHLPPVYQLTPQILVNIAPGR